MTKQRRRLRSVFVLAFLATAAGVAAGIVTLISRPEAVVRFHAVAMVEASGHAEVHESILYHFPQERHGIYRDLPDVSFFDSDKIKVTTDTNDDVSVIPATSGIRLKIGDPSQTVSGDHHYNISYPLSTVDLGNGRFGWNAVGASWSVPVDQTVADFIAPWRWAYATCDAGGSGSVGNCTVSQPVPGRLEVSYGRLRSGEGLTIYATRGAALAAAPAARSVDMTAPPTSWSQRPVTLGVVTAFAALLTALIVARLLRRSGRDWVMAGPASTTGAADVAFPAPAAPGVQVGARRVDDTELDQWATTEFAPPQSLAAWQGGVLYAETPGANHRVAWLLGLAESGQVTIDESTPKSPVLRRGQAGADAEVSALLDVAFAGREAITLGSYDRDFTSMWASLPAKMTQWYRSAGLTDPAGERRVNKARLIGLGGIVVAGFIGFLAARSTVKHAVGGIVWAGFAAMIWGAAFAALTRAWELHVRTPAGSSMWLRVESFRRFIAASEAEHVRQAADRGVLRDYTAWAIALDEVAHWTKAVEAAGLPPSTPGLDTALAASVISSSMQSAGTTPSSSGSGGGGVGGGGGGGGGGSW